MRLWTIWHPVSTGFGFSKCARMEFVFFHVGSASQSCWYGDSSVTLKGLTRGTGARPPHTTLET
eukprot:15473277-Heterocapsa_arctica.AAC.1